MQHGRESQTVSLFRDQVRKLQEQLDFLKDEKEFHDPDSSSSSGRSHVPHQPLIASSSRRKPSRESGLLRNTREEVSIPGNVFACQLVRQNLGELCNDSGNLATSSRMNRRDGVEKSESRESVQGKSRDSGDCPMRSTHNHSWCIGTFTQSGMTNYRCYQTPEMHLGKIPDHTDFFKLESEFQNVSVFESEKSSSCYPVDL